MLMEHNERVELSRT